MESINIAADVLSLLMLDFELLLSPEHNPHLEIIIKVREVNI